MSGDTFSSNENCFPSELHALLPPDLAGFSCFHLTVHFDLALRDGKLPEAWKLLENYLRATGCGNLP